jgi:hypothetical protein
MTRGQLATTALLLGWGAALLARPDAVAGAVLGGSPVPPLPVIRVLGARSLLQQLVLLLRPSRGVGRAATGVEVLHALSMGAAAVAWPEYRRAELLSAGMAAGGAVVALRVAGDAGRRAALWADR